MHQLNAFPPRAKFDKRRAISLDVIALPFADLIPDILLFQDLGDSPKEVIEVRRVLIDVASSERVFPQHNGSGGGSFGGGLDISGDHVAFGQLDLGELIVGGGKSTREHFIRWSGDSKREVGEVDEE